MPVHAFIFPGQGSQAVGMGRDLAAAFAAAREVFEEVDETLKQKLSKLMFEGPGEELDPHREHPARPDGALARRAARAGEGRRLHAAPEGGRGRRPLAGRILGARRRRRFSIADAARLLKLRGQTMQKAVPAGEGAMAALLGAEMAQAEAICAEAAPVPDSETARARGDRARQRQRRRPDRGLRPSRRGRTRRGARRRRNGVRRAMLLPVSAPFHCALMAPGGRRHGRGAGRHAAARADRAAGRQRLRRQGHRSGGNPRPAGPPGHRHGALARMRQRDGRSSAWTASSNSAPARCCPD